MYHTFTQMAYVYVSQLKYMFLPYWLVAIYISLLCNYFNMAAVLQKHVVNFKYEHLVSIIVIFWYSIQKKYHP